MFVTIKTKIENHQQKVRRYLFRKLLEDILLKNVSIVLKQNQSNKPLTDEEKLRFYKYFRNRTLKKSEHNYFDLKEKPILLRLYFEGSIFDSTTEFLVTYHSFSRIKNEKGEEIGFSATIKTIIVDIPILLTVDKESFTAKLKVV